MRGPGSPIANVRTGLILIDIILLKFWES